MTKKATEAAQNFVRVWREEFVGVMQAMGDCRPEMEISFVPPDIDGGMLWWNQPFDLADGASVWIGSAQETWSVLGGRVLDGAGVPSSDPTELKDTYLEVLRQSLGALARTVGGQWKREIAVTAGAEQAPPRDLSFACQIAIGVTDQRLPALAFFASDEMAGALQDWLNQVAADAAPAPSEAKDDEPGRPEFSARACGTLDLLLDVEMPVSVSFGRTQVRIQDILKLITGSIIELDRSISEPVDVIVNNCTIARGEVVVVDGNYGIRINEVMSRRERLQESRKYLLPSSAAR